VFGKYSVGISGVILAVVAEVLRVFCQSLQAIVGIVYRIDHNFILPNPFQLTNNPVI
jgi:hypothetical protein